MHVNDPTYAICIPCVDSNDHVTQLLRDLLTSIQWGKYKCPVILAWDNAKQETIDQFQKEFPFTTSLPYFGEKNLNFTKNSNRGLRYAYEKLHLGCFLVNQDTLLPDHEYLEKIINNGISSPRAVHAEGTTPTQQVFNLNKTNSPGCPCRKGKPVQVSATNKFAFFCCWFSKYAISKVGYLDDQTFYSSFEDDDYSVRTCLAGLPCEQYEIHVHHELKGREIQISTTDSYSLQDLGISMQRFAIKWQIPEYIGHEQFAEYILKNHEWSDRWKVN